jgi:hypothetical protein
MPQERDEFQSQFNGEFVPNDLSIRLNIPSSVWQKKDEMAIEAASVFRHEFHHYNTIVGTTWGIMHVRYSRSLANLALKLIHENIAPLFRSRGQRIPYPLELLCNPDSAKFDEDVAKALQPFWIYKSAIDFDLGTIEAFPLDSENSAALPSIQMGQHSKAFGTLWLVETAARLEDRLIWNDFECRKWHYESKYDFLWIWCRTMGVTDPLLILIALDLALNPVLPLTAQEKSLPFYERLPASRFLRLIDILSGMRLLDFVPQTAVRRGQTFVRGELNAAHSALLNTLCKATEWDHPTTAIKGYLDSDDPWTNWGIRKEYMKLVVKMREQNPSIFAMQHLANPQNRFGTTYPPLWIRFQDAAASTIKDPKIGAMENIEMIKNSIARQIVSRGSYPTYECPFCGRAILRSGDHGQCSAELHSRAIGFEIEDFLPLG